MAFPDVSHLELGQQLPAGTFDWKCHQQVRTWLNVCCDSHTACNEDWRTSLDFPMRLLRVSPQLGNHIVLEEYAAGERRPPYITMSHCWETFNEEQVLTSANINQLKTGLAKNSLAQKFRDVVEIAQWLQVEYLWVDALCIMQDSAHDWEQQSKVMGNIYAGSLCNIAAAGDIGTNSSCFRKRPVEIVEPFCIPDPTQSSSSTETHVIGYDDFWCNSLLDAKLHSRAWVLQERLLAPRTIHFGKEQIYWECRVSKACEAYPDGIPHQFTNHRTKAWREGEQIFNPRSSTVSLNSVSKVASIDITALMADLRLQGCPPQISIPSDEAKHFWSRTVERYMGCDMSFPSDKLIAIAGLAEKMQATTKEPYLAGLWHNDFLAQSLLWFVPASKQTDGRRSVRYPSLGEAGYRAPSFSWASIDGSITWISPAPCDKVLLNITDAYANPAGDNPVGAVESAAIFAQGTLLPVRVDIANQHEDGSLDEDGTYLLTARHEHGLQSSIGNEISSRATSESEPIELQPLIYLDTDLSPLSGIDAYVLPICTQWRGRTGRVIAAVAGLLVRKVESVHCRPTFERFGVIGLDEEEAEYLCSGENEAEAAACELVLV